MEGAPTPDDYWAKLDENDDGEIESWHPLHAHSLDVAETFRALVEKSILRRRLGTLLQDDPLTDVQISRLAAMAALHDVGKVNHGFQNRGVDVDGPTRGHVRPLVDFAEAERPDKAPILEALELRPLVDWFDGQRTFFAMLMATLGHHGRPVIPEHGFERQLWEPNERRDPLGTMVDLRTSIEDWFPRAFEGDAPNIGGEPRFQHAYNGALTLADWVASDRTFFEFEADGEDRRQTASSKARVAAEQLGLDPSPYRSSMDAEPPGFAPFSEIETPYPVQEAAREQPVHPEGSLTILESDTGSGKTEAAIARFFELYHAGEVDGLYFALPTRSAATELHDRVREAVQRAFDDPPPVVQAVPGYIQADETRATRLPNFEVRWDDDPDAGQRARRWAAEQSKRYLAGAVVVGTIDQVLLAALQAEHAHLRGTALLRHLLVVDEVHASEPYMTMLLETALDQHLAAGGHAFLMSATLGSVARHRFATGGGADPPTLEEATDADYPLVTHATASRKSPSYTHAASSNYSKTVRPDTCPLADRPETVAERAVEAAREGARVLVIRNTVSDCRETQRAVEALADDDLLFGVDGTPAPHHSRFAPDDRTLLDGTVESTFGLDADVGSGVVCVATQTVEQSLDIDADRLLTDLAPVDVLLQRIGRLHRHGDRPRPDGYGEARVDVLVPDDRDLGAEIEDDGSAHGDHGYGTVYTDLRTLEAAWRLVDDHDSWTIPDMNRRLVEHGTHPDKLEAIAAEAGGDWETHEQHVLAVRSAEVWKGREWKIDYDEDFADPRNSFPDYAEVEETVRTRLGGDDFQLELDDPVDGPFGEPIDELSIPSWLIDADVDELDDPELDGLQTTNDGLEFSFAGETFRYTRHGITRAE